MSRYHPELFDGETSVPLYPEEAACCMELVRLMRENPSPRRESGRRMGRVADIAACRMRDAGASEEAIAQAMGVGVAAVRGAIRRVESGRYDAEAGIA